MVIATFTVSESPTSFKLERFVYVTLVIALESKVFPEILLFNVKLSSTFVKRLIFSPVYLYCVFLRLTDKSFLSLSVKSLSLALAGVF